ncbi:phosphatase PAP2 family protein [Leptospira levettii]|uniref:phosphatase PAP2 family protein n=1 Tax=Leptospira levettii TaxID=2023178 RepID=UPI001084789F|nr:phosphatase PAP2 family protein [Leptospira levettii]TGM29788.1 phosphatase PAP2 family protein [Leptospira levettii]TGM75847.1 phosphatase PAP2 family protein [Leptospira levettii]TGM92131.1 phosphatase PAP2 family protein [Leptospira levettii]
MNWINRVDLKLSTWIQKHLHHKNLSWVLSRINRGEMFALVLLPLMFLSDLYKPVYMSLPFVLVFTYMTDRLVLVLKKYFARKRPLVSVMGKVDSNPDMKHSFPSAHSANSIVVATILVFAFRETPYFFLFSLFAGVGRLITLHHFVSDIIGGWVIGFVIGIFAVIIHFFLWPYLVTL